MTFQKHLFSTLTLSPRHFGQTSLSEDVDEVSNTDLEVELRKTQAEILTLEQILASKERHAAALKIQLGIAAWRELSEDVTQGLKDLQESATYKRTAEKIQVAKEVAKEKTKKFLNNDLENLFTPSSSKKV